MTRILLSLVLASAFITAGTSSASVGNYVFTGEVKCLDGSPIYNAQVVVRYVWTVAGQAPLEGRETVYTDANGVYTLVDGGIPDVVESVEAWAWVGDKGKSIQNCQPGTNYIGYFKFLCGYLDIYYDAPTNP